MKLTKETLKQLIKEEYDAMAEQDMTPAPPTQSVLGDEDLDKLDQELGTGEYEPGCHGEEWPMDFVDWLMHSPDGDRLRAEYEAEKAARGARPPRDPRSFMKESRNVKLTKQTLQEMIRKELNT